MSKQCPKCKRIYEDLELNYCLDDGTRLESELESEKTLFMSTVAVNDLDISETDSPKTNVKYLFGMGISLSVVIVVIIIWFIFGFGSSATYDVASRQASETPQATGSVKADEWIFILDFASGDHRVDYSIQGHTLKLRFSNKWSSSVRITYVLNAEYRKGNEWIKFVGPQSIVTIDAGQTQMDNYPIPPGRFEIRNVELKKLDWEYLE